MAATALNCPSCPTCPAEDLLVRDYKYFSLARKAAEESTFKVRVGAIAVYRGKIIASASSTNKTDPMQYTYNKYRSFNQVGACLPKAHAEIGLVKKMLKTAVPVQEVKVYVYRLCKSRDKGIARPCDACMRALKDAGIRVVYYTTDFGYAKEWIQ